MNTRFIQKLRNVALPALFLWMLPSIAGAAVLTADTVWQGEVKIIEDVLVPEGVTLLIRPGARITIVSAESTKTDPEYLSPLIEITVRGSLRVEGTGASPIEFFGEEKKTAAWAGIIVDHGIATMQACRISDAETAVYVLDGNLVLKDSVLRGNRYGLVAQGDKAEALVEDSRITQNDYGVFALQNAQVSSSTAVIKENRKKDKYFASVREYKPDTRFSFNDTMRVGRQYHDEVLLGETVWQGRIEVSGTIRVPEGSRLIVMPGAIVEFRKNDTNGDGIGENGLLIQGRIIAKGTPEQPILFRSAEKVKRMGDWDSINIMNSDGAQNLIEYCRIEHAYRGLHFHFSNVAVHDSVIRNNYRGVQFQESLVELKGNQVYGNKSGVQGRDSEILFFDNAVGNNYSGVNFFRAKLIARGNKILGNWKEGFRVREGVCTLQENLIDANRYGLMAADAFYGDYSRNLISNNTEVGFALRNVDNIEISGNFISGNGLNGLNLQDARASIKRNTVSDNGERGIGTLSFDGVITENNFVGNGLYAVDLEGKADVSAPFNWWGGDDKEKVIYDQADDPSRGKVRNEKASARPFPFVWPQQTLHTDLTWRGVVHINNTLTVLPGATLTIAPSTTVAFSAGAGLTVRGKLLAAGAGNGKILFTSVQKKDQSDWDELLLEHADGSVISHCIIEYATWGVHSHFTDLSISDSRFRKNYGGMRFRSGPVSVKHSLFEENTIGIRSYRGNAVITGNVIRNNETGIFVREKGSGLTIGRNNLFANSNYNVRIGDFNDEDVNAKENWWGSGDPADTIFDGSKEPGIGKVLYKPYLKKPVKIDLGEMH